MLKYKYTRQPYDYQIVALKRAFRVKRLLLWFDPGEGKTKVALDFIAAMLFYRKIKKALIIAPLKAIFGVWQEQFELDAPNLTYSIIHPDVITNWNSRVLLTNYDQVIARRSSNGEKRNRENLNRLIEWQPNIVIADESHRIKNPYSQSSKALHKLGLVCEYALCLTGTPKGNKRVLDLWSQMHFLVPDILEEKFSDFRDHYSIKQGFGGFEIIKFRDLPQLSKLIHPYLMIKKANVKHEPRHINIRIDLSPKFHDMYQQMEKEFLLQLDKERVITAPIVLAKLTKLSQMTGGFIIDNDGETHAIHRAKLEALAELVEDLRGADVERIVVFARFLWEIKEIRKVLYPYSVYEISGETKPNDVKLAMSLFNSQGGAVICQIASGSASLNLQAANYGVFYSTDYSFINYTQALARLRPQLQMKSCFYYHLRCKGTIDTHIAAILESQRGADENFRELLEGIKRDVNKTT